MIIYDNLIILSVPKTATHSIEKEVKHPNLVLADIPTGREMRHCDVANQSFYTGQPIAAMIRNPIEWLKSWFNYLNTAVNSNHPASSAHKSFDGFVEMWFEKGPQLPHHFVSQSDYLLNDGNPPEHLFRFAHMDKFIEFINDITSENISISKRNVSFKRKIIMSSETESIIRANMAIDYEIYNSAK